MGQKSISIIGTGALGSVLARSFYELSWPVKSLYNRSFESVKNLAKETNVIETDIFPAEKRDLGRLIFLAVPDRAIEKTAEKLAALDDDFSEYIVVHCSGSKSSAILKPIQEKGAGTASFHPVQTFVSSSFPSDFQDIYIDIEGDNKAVELLKSIAEKFGSKTLPITPDAKPYLHAAGVMASNYVIALMEAASEIAAMGGLDKKEAQRALLPLMQKSVTNIADSDHLLGALSGPIARGDTSTVANHLKLLEQNPRLSSLYKKLGEGLTQLLKKNDGFSEQKLEEITEILHKG
jgi:predicted short-subunit dehydrogenase-like oxidoreductase (DUF2520 family)